MYRKYFKRLFDLCFAGAALAAFLPVFFMVGAAVRLTSRGPVFFRQERAGRGGKYFRIFKFRTMTVDRGAESRGFEPGHRRRVTAVGKILRKTKLDELPQLLNVIRGDMSVVGPRPEVRQYVELCPERWARVLSERPGITDSASIIFRDEEEILASAADPEAEYRNVVMPRKLDLYEAYVSDITLRGDIKIMLETFFAVALK